MKTISILGSTGSIGTQALEIINAHPKSFKVVGLLANNNVDLLAEQAIKYKPAMVCIVDKIKYPKLKKKLSHTKIKILTGEAGMLALIEGYSVDLIISAIVGIAGLKPTLHAIDQGIDIALANKESLVVAGSIIKEKLKKKNVRIIPIDSEHSAIFQCLLGEDMDAVQNIILTASGGPFRDISQADWKKITLTQALKHPNWSMGKKISIDSATMINKGLEVIEARWLFDIQAKNIQVVVHPQSLIHSMVEMIDGSIKAQMGIPSMKIPIQYALSYPNRITAPLAYFAIDKFSQLSFQEVNHKRFPCLNLAYESLAIGGNACCILNAANEYAVSLFLKEKIAFDQIPKIIRQAMDNIETIFNPSIQDIYQTDLETRAWLAKKNH